MRTPGHMAGSYIVVREVVNHMPASVPNPTLLIVLGTLAGALPDLDYFYYAIKSGGLKYETDFQHHKWISHTFPFYIIPGAMIYLLGFWLNSPIVKSISLVVTVGAVIHLLLDMVGSGDGIMWAWPFSKRMDGVHLLNVHGKEWAKVYAKHPISWVERTIIIIALFFLVFDVFSWLL